MSAPITSSASSWHPSLIRHEPQFLLDPMRLDSAAHGLFSVFPELRYEERGVTFIPIRIDEVILYRPHVVPARAINEIVSKSERSIVANAYLYDGEGNIIAIFAMFAAKRSMSGGQIELRTLRSSNDPNFLMASSSATPACVPMWPMWLPARRI